MEDRRAFLRLAAFGLASTALVRGAEAAPAEPASAPAPSEPPSEGPWWLLHPVGPGSEIGLGWRVNGLSPAREGAVTLTLAHADGRVARVDLSLREGKAKGPASTTCIDFIVMDGGNGASPMDESLGRALRRLAAIVEENEGRDLSTLARLQPHHERVWRHAEALAVAAADSSLVDPG